MKEKYLYIEPEKVNALINRIHDMKPAKRGFHSHVFLVDAYAVLMADDIKLRNVTTRDDDLGYFDELIHTLMRLRAQDVAVVPILGYCFDQDSKNGCGYVFQPRAKGEELYDDAIMGTFYVWEQENPESFYLSSDADAKEYILSRTSDISKVPQKHFDKFIRDIIILLDHDILIDFHGKSNIFYDDTAGFQFIDLNSHTDYRYGLTDHKPESKELASCYGFAPCHFAVTTHVLPRIALHEKAISRLDEKELQQLARDNRTIFEKCENAMQNNGISAEQLDRSLETLKIYGR